MTPEQFSHYQTSRDCADKRSLCHAPSYGLHLAQNGSVLACGYTRFDPLGYYPKQSLTEIWFGEKAEAMRRAMRGRDFPKSCQMCRTQAEGGLYQQLRARAYDSLARGPVDKALFKARHFLRTGKFAEMPTSISFELANTCNLECVMCLGMLSSSIRQNREKLPPLPQHYGPELLEELRVFVPHLREALFFGGEPFLINLYLDIWELFIELNPNCKLCITTNGTVLNNRVRRIIESLPNLEVVVSLDAVTKETYETIRVNASFERVMENLLYFRDAMRRHGRRLMITPTFMVHNALEFQTLWDFCNREDITLDVGILTTPPEMSLANQSVEFIERVHRLWAGHVPAPCADPLLAENNRRAFQVAIDHAAFWLEERKAYLADPMGQRLTTFVAANKMELCVSKSLEHTLRSTHDLGLSLRLLELWAEPGNKLEDWGRAISALVGHLYPEHPAERARTGAEHLVAAWSERFGPEEQMQIAQHLLGLENPWQPLLLLRDAQYGSLDELVAQMAQKPAVPQLETSFF
jgi:MoaA/NifB/PqqE/SkfB family radical SAM enzyme